MKKKTIISLTAVWGMALLAGCGTQKTVTTPVAKDTVVATVDTAWHDIVADAQANSQFMSLHDAGIIARTPGELSTLAKKYGYKTINNYGVYRLDSYAKMLYRNCTPAKRVSKDVYADLPQPQRKGTSSYVAVNGHTVIIGVFNDKAYANLLQQVKNGGLRLVEQGYEDHYTNGSLDVYCYGTRRTVRVEKR